MEQAKQSASILVLGVGNTLLTDEGAGIHAVRRLQARGEPTERVRYLDGGTLSFTLAGPIAEAGCLIVIDAAQLRRAAGSVETFLDDDMDRFLGRQAKRSVHEVGLLDLMQIGQLTRSLPRRRALIAIQPASVDWGEQPTPSVEAGIELACRRATELIESWES